MSTTSVPVAYALAEVRILTPELMCFATAGHFTGLLGGCRPRLVLGRRSLRFEPETTVIRTQVLRGFPQSQQGIDYMEYSHTTRTLLVVPKEF
jgi:hypothetical protein